MQHHLAQRHAVAEAVAGELPRPPEVDVLAGLDQRIEVGGRHHLGEQRRRGQHRLDLIFAIGVRIAVLHHQHAQRLAGAQHRHAEERLERIFTGFRPIGESGVRRGVVEAERFGLRRDQADEAFAQPERRHVHGAGREAAGREQLEGAVIAQHVERADVRVHVVGNETDDLVEPSLRSQRLRHGFAQLLQQHARPADRYGHRSRPAARRRPIASGAVTGV